MYRATWKSEGPDHQLGGRVLCTCMYACILLPMLCVYVCMVCQRCMLYDDVYSHDRDKGEKGGKILTHYVHKSAKMLHTWGKNHEAERCADEHKLREEYARAETDLQEDPQNTWLHENLAYCK